MGTREYSEYEMTMMICLRTMRAWEFSTQVRGQWMIWAAKYQVCPTCLSPVGKPCLNMMDIRNKKPEPRINLWPHDPRVDWNKVLEGLKYRKYYRPVIESTVRREVKSD